MVPARVDPYETFELHVKCATIVFWQWIWAFVYASAVVPTNSGEMDESKVEFTWTKFMREYCLRCNNKHLGGASGKRVTFR